MAAASVSLVRLQRLDLQGVGGIVHRERQGAILHLHRAGHPARVLQPDRIDQDHAVELAEAAVAGGQQQGLRRGRSVGGEGGVVERVARGRQRARERELAAAGFQGAHQVDHAARPLRPPERLHRHEVPAFLPGPQEPGQEQREIASVQRDPGAPIQRLQGIVEAGGHRPEQPAGVGGLQLGGGDPQVLGHLVELGGGGPQGGDVDRADRLGGGQTQVVPAQRVRRIDHGQARLGGLL